jgi:hypothetical protein
MDDLREGECKESQDHRPRSLFVFSSSRLCTFASLRSPQISASFFADLRLTFAFNVCVYRVFRAWADT